MASVSRDKDTSTTEALSGSEVNTDARDTEEKAAVALVETALLIYPLAAVRWAAWRSWSTRTNIGAASSEVVAAVEVLDDMAADDDGRADAPVPASHVSFPSRRDRKWLGIEDEPLLPSRSASDVA